MVNSTVPLRVLTSLINHARLGTCPRTADVLTLTPYKYPSIQLSDCSIGEMQVISRAVGDGEEGGSADYTLYHIEMTRTVILITVIYLSLSLN